MAYVKNINGYDIKDAEAREDIERLERTYHAPNYVLIGDSYGYDATRDGTDITGWINRFKSRYGLVENSDCFSRAEAGAGFSSESSSGRTFQEIMEYIAENMTEEQRINTGHIVVAGGANDTIAPHNTADYYSIFASFRSSMRSLFPNASLTVVPIGMDNSTRTRRLRAPAVYAAYQSACEGLNINFAWGAWFFRYDKRTEVSDHLHLNTEGQRIATSMIMNAINGGSCGYYARETMTVTKDSAFGGGTFSIEVILQDGLITFNLVELNKLFTYSTPTALTMNNSFKGLGTFESSILPDNCYIVTRTGVRTRDNATGIFYEAGGIMSYANNNLSVNAPYADGLTGYKSISECSQIGVDFNDFVASAFTM